VPLKPKSPKIVVFADLDGTILNESYDSSEVEPIIRQLLSLNVSIVLCSSKTKGEIEFYRRKLGISDPFIVENGSAILIPKRYFQSSYRYTKQADGYCVIELGIAYSIIRKRLAVVKKRTTANIIGFGDMTVEEIAKDSGLTLQLANLAKKRAYDEPFRIVAGNKKEILNAIKNEGLSYTIGNRYFHLLGNSDKGKAAVILKDLYSKKFGKITTIGIGDSPNDLPMLKIVNKQLLMKKTTGKDASFMAWREILNFVLTARANEIT
jgi:mannosyl-3-phosphoglycerate phosphatase